MSIAFRPDVVLTETEYGWVLLDEAEGEFYSLNPTAVVALRVLLDGGSTEEAVRTVTATYEVDAETAAADLDELIDELLAANLVRA